jgi:hypothetical protein
MKTHGRENSVESGCADEVALVSIALTFSDPSLPVSI